MEEHKLDSGMKIIVEYLADNGFDIVKKMNERVIQLEQQFIDDKVVKDAQAIVDSAFLKRDFYLKSQTDASLKSTIGLTDAEVAVIKSG